MANDPRNPALYRNRAAAFAQLGLWKDCMADTEMVVNLMPNNRKAMLRHKAVVDYVNNFNDSRGPGYERQNLTVINLLTPEEFTANNYTDRLTAKISMKPPKVRTLTDPMPAAFYENGSPTTEVTHPCYHARVQHLDSTHICDFHGALTKCCLFSHCSGHSHAAPDTSGKPS